jgi:hypothetical protein
MMSAHKVPSEKESLSGYGADVRVRVCVCVCVCVFVGGGGLIAVPPCLSLMCKLFIVSVFVCFTSYCMLFPPPFASELMHKR